MCYFDAFSHYDVVIICFGWVGGGRSASIIHILIELENFKIEISNSNSSIYSLMFFLSIKKISGVSSGKTINKIVITAQ